jgi:hypothetical protein
VIGLKKGSARPISAYFSGRQVQAVSGAVLVGHSGKSWQGAIDGRLLASW